ncbi:MAG: hypothetical protein IJ841_10805 [Prevotella sp.]|nr:hypothetical protein [Prevotella sp.]
MALIKCSECGQVMSDKAPTCPNCGNPNMAATRHGGNESIGLVAKVLLSAMAIAVVAGLGYWFAISTHTPSEASLQNEEQDATEMQAQAAAENQESQTGDAAAEAGNESRAAEPQAREARNEVRDGFKEKGWRYVCSHLKSPSTAQLVAYLPPTDEKMAVFAQKVDLPGLNVAVFSVDAQNSFGATIRQTFMVFFKNMTPMHMEDAESLRGEFSLMRTTLKVNGYDDI